MIEEAMRKAFEAWIAEDRGDLSTFGTGKNVHYRNSAVNNAWLGWQAATRAVPARPLTEYHEDMGPVVWWSFPVNEPAWIGRPDDSDWPGYHTHFTPHPAAPEAP